MKEAKDLRVSQGLVPGDRSQDSYYTLTYTLAGEHRRQNANAGELET